VLISGTRIDGREAAGCLLSRVASFSRFRRRSQRDWRRRFPVNRLQIACINRKRSAALTRSTPTTVGWAPWLLVFRRTLMRRRFLKIFSVTAPSAEPGRVCPARPPAGHCNL